MRLPNQSVGHLPLAMGYINSTSVQAQAIPPGLPPRGGGSDPFIADPNCIRLQQLGYECPGGDGSSGGSGDGGGGGGDGACDTGCEVAWLAASAVCSAFAWPANAICLGAAGIAFGICKAACP